MPSVNGRLNSIAAAQQSGNRGAEVWGVDSGGQIWTDWQSTAGGAWNGWEGPGFKGQPAPMWQVAVADQSNGNLMLFALDRGGWVSTIAQYAPGGDWGGWSGSAVGGQPVPFMQIAAAQQGGGRGVELWGIDADGQIWTLWQATPGGAWAGWEGPGFKGQTVAMRRVAAVNQGNGMVQLFALDTGGALWGIAQYAAGGDWSNWQGPGFAASSHTYVDLAAVQGSGGAQLWAMAVDGALWTIYQTTPGSGWSGWQGPGFPAGSQPVAMSDVAAAGQHNGRMIVVALDAPAAGMWSIGQTAGGGWSQWTQRPSGPAGLTSGWDVVGSNSSEVVSAGNMLFSVDATNGNISMYSGTPGQWTQIGGPGHQLAGTEDDLYGISPDKSGVWRLDSATLQWAQIGGQMDKLITARPVVHGVDEHGLAWMYSGTPNQWMSIGGPFRDLDANDDFCFAVAADGSSVSMAPCGTTNWTTIGGAMETVWATGNAVYGVDVSGQIWLWSGVAMQWTAIGGPFAQISTWGVRLFGLTADKSTVLEYRLDLGGVWQPVTGGCDEFTAGRGYVAGIRSDTVLTHRLGHSSAPSPDLAAAEPEMAVAARNGPPTMDWEWLFEFKTADVAFAGYDGWIKFLMNGTNEHRLGRTHFERGARYTFPTMTGQAPVTSLQTLTLQGEKHFLPDHWTVGEITAWNLKTEFMYHFTVNQDIPNELDRPKSWLSVSPDNVEHTAAPPSPAYVYIWTYVAFYDAVGHASMMLSDEETYISWWPQGGDVRKSLPWVGLAFDAPHVDDQTYENDIAPKTGEGRPPDLVLPIWNLDETAVKAWWEPYNATAANRWKALASNCSTIVFKALQAGNALNGLTAGEWQLYCENQPWTPSDVASLVKLLQSKHTAAGEARAPQDQAAAS